MDILGTFSTIFAKRGNFQGFLFLFHTPNSFWKWGLSQKGKNSLLRYKFFSQCRLIDKGGKKTFQTESLPLQVNPFLLNSQKPLSLLGKAIQGN